MKSALTVESQWHGRDYARTLRAWLDRIDAKRDAMDAIFREDLPPREARRAAQRWRMFFMACEELFAHDEGRTWIVVHSLLRPNTSGAG